MALGWSLGWMLRLTKANEDIIDCVEKVYLITGHSLPILTDMFIRSCCKLSLVYKEHDILQTQDPCTSLGLYLISIAESAYSPVDMVAHHSRETISYIHTRVSIE